MVRSIRTRAILLRSVDFGEADRVLTFLTPAAGIVGVMARGARSSRRRFGGCLEPFCVVDIEYVRGRGDLGRLQQARIAAAFPGILASLGRMHAGGTILELGRTHLAPDSPDIPAFEATAAALGALDAAEPDHTARIVTAYRARLLGLTGVTPQLEACGRCGRRPGPSQSAQFDAHGAQLVCRACGGASRLLSSQSRALMGALCGSGWLEAAAVEWPSRVANEVSSALEAMTPRRAGSARG